jgi:hypothetical protein
MNKDRANMLPPLILVVSAHNRHRSEEMKSMAWVYLLLAGFFEIGWPVG